jgi:hypothetical protein
MSVTRVVRGLLPALALTGLCLAACGSEEPGADDATSKTQESPSGDTSGSAPSGAQDCATVWQDGGTLPRTYRGCVDDGAHYVPQDALGCESGQRIIRYADRFYGVPGGTVHAVSTSLEKDHEYRAAVLRCRA